MKEKTRCCSFGELMPWEVFKDTAPKYVRGYRGFIEHNGTEGEDYGYYFPASRDTGSFLDALRRKFSHWAVLTGKPDGYSMDYDETYTERDLEMMNLGAKNRYNKRCYIVNNPVEMLQMLIKVDDNESLPYFGVFTVDGKEYDLKS